MAYEFCNPCKPNTKKKCASCLKKNNHVSTGEARMVIRPTISYFGEIYKHASKDEEEYW